MLDRVADSVIVFRDLIAAAVPGCLLLAAAVWLCTRKFSWNGPGRYLYGWFLNRSDGALFLVSASLLQFFFVLSAAVLGTEMAPEHLLFLCLTALGKAAAGCFSERGTLRAMAVLGRDLLNSLLLFAACMVGNILSGYLRETRFNIYVVTVLVFLRIFLVVYSGYFLMKDISDAERDEAYGQKRKERGRKRKEK